VGLRARRTWRLPGPPRVPWTGVLDAARVAPVSAVADNCRHGHEALVADAGQLDSLVVLDSATICVSAMPPDSDLAPVREGGITVTTTEEIAASHARTEALEP